MKYKLAYFCLVDQFTYQLILMSILFDDLLSNIAGSRCFSPSFFKKVDTIYKPKCRNHTIDWPILVSDSGLFKRLACLKIDA